MPQASTSAGPPDSPKFPGSFGEDPLEPILSEITSLNDPLTTSEDKKLTEALTKILNIGTFISEFSKTNNSSEEVLWAEVSKMVRIDVMVLRKLYRKALKRRIELRR